MEFKKGERVRLKTEYNETHPDFVGNTYIVLSSEVNHKPSLLDKILIKEEGSMTARRASGNHFERA